MKKQHTSEVESLQAALQTLKSDQGDKLQQDKTEQAKLQEREEEELKKLQQALKDADQHREAYEQAVAAGKKADEQLTELERKLKNEAEAKAKAEQDRQEFETIVRDLRHKSLAYALGQAKQNRLA